MHYFPLAWPFLLVLGVLLVVVIGLIELRVLSYAYLRMGIQPRWVALILALSFLGSYVNLPIAQLPPERVMSDAVVSAFGIEYVVPTAHEWPGTVVCINVGGALIPMVLSFYLLLKSRMYARGVVAVVMVACIVHLVAKPVRGVGITVPILVPPLAAAGIAMLLAWRRAPPLAYIAGSMGTLIGADVLNLGRLHNLGAPIASIGGAGTFDSVFLSGIIAVLLPPMGARAQEPEQREDEARGARPPAEHPWR